MKAEYVQTGNDIYYTNSGETEIAFGEVVVYGDRIGIAADNIAAGATGVLHLCGAFRMTKASEAISAGNALYYDADNDRVTKTYAEGLAAAGIALTTVSADDTAVLVRLGTHSGAAGSDVSGLAADIGDISDLTTTAKDDIVAAINELVTRVAAIEDA